MNTIKYVAATSLALGLLTLGMVSPVFANTAEQNQKLEQEFEVQCNSGAYGQTSTCKVLGKQFGEQSQKIALRDGIKPHKVVDTALDFQSMAAVGAVVSTGVGAAILKRKVA